MIQDIVTDYVSISSYTLLNTKYFPHIRLYLVRILHMKQVGGDSACIFVTL